MESGLEKKLRRYALFRISRMNYFSKDLERLLVRKGADQLVSEQITEDLVEKGYINDEDWVQSYIQRKSTQGWQKTVLELKRRGVEKDLLDRYRPADIEEKQRLYAVAKKKFKRFGETESMVRAKLIPYLMRKGFSYNVVQEVLQELCDTNF